MLIIKLIFFGFFKFCTNSYNDEKNSKKKFRYFRFPQNLAHSKLIDLANYVPSSSHRGVLSFTQRFLSGTLVSTSQAALGYLVMPHSYI